MSQDIVPAVSTPDTEAADKLVISALIPVTLVKYRFSVSKEVIHDASSNGSLSFISYIHS
jgi:hypothetical protein